jgi:hypothetical protein
MVVPTSIKRTDGQTSDGGKKLEAPGLDEDKEYGVTQGNSAQAILSTPRRTPEDSPAMSGRNNELASGSTIGNSF